jgi:hypothetical protein
VEVLVLVQYEGVGLRLQGSPLAPIAVYLAQAVHTGVVVRWMRQLLRSACHGFQSRLEPRKPRH